MKRRKIQTYKTYIILLLILFITIQINVLSQNSPDREIMVLTKNDTVKGEKAIKIKWFWKDLFTKNGVNIYRQESSDSNWIRITNNPIIPGNYNIPKSEFEKDKLLKKLLNIVNYNNPREIDKMVLFSILIKAIQNNEFAKYIGILYEDTTIEQGKTYAYKIYKITTSGEEELGASNKIKAAIKKSISPPADFQVRPIDKAVQLSWKPEIERYFAVNVYRSMANSINFEKINRTPVMISEIKDKNGEKKFPEICYTDRGVKNDTSYIYKIKAIDFFGEESTPSYRQEATPASLVPPPAPNEVILKTEKDKVYIKWEYDKTIKIEGFNIYRSKNFDSGYKKVNKDILHQKNREYLDTIPEPGEYFYYVSSVAKDSVEGPSFKAHVEVFDYIPPDNPKNLKIISDTGKFILNWDTNTELDLWGYYIYRRLYNSTEQIKINAIPVKKSMYIDYQYTNVKDKFYYTVTAIDTSYNQSAHSNEVISRLPDVTPPVRPYIKEITQGENSLVIKWVPNSESDLITYHIYRKEKDTKEAQMIKINKSDIEKNVTSYNDITINKGISYEYFIVAEDSTGNQSDYSESYPAKYKLELAKEVMINEVKTKFNRRGKKIIISWKKPSEKEEYLGVKVYKKKENANFKSCSGLIINNVFEDKKIDPITNYYYQLRTYTSSGKVWKSEEIQVETGKFKK